MVTRIVSGSTGKFLGSFMSSEVSLRKEGMAFISGCNRQKSTYCEIFSVGLLRNFLSIKDVSHISSSIEDSILDVMSGTVVMYSGMII